MEKLLVGRVARVKNAFDAVSCLQNGRNVAGVIFPFRKGLPPLDEKQQLMLQENFSLKLLSADGKIIGKSKVRDAFREDMSWAQDYIDGATELLELAGQFNHSSRDRDCSFFLNNALQEPTHVDIWASQLWAHWHIAKRGMKLYSPVDADVLELDYDETFSRYDDVPCPKSFAAALSAGKLESMHLQEGEVIVFNDHMLHSSSFDDRFRCLVR